MTLKVLGSYYLSSAGKKINNLTLTCKDLGKNANFPNICSLRLRQFGFFLLASLELIISCMFARDSSISILPARFGLMQL